MSIFTKAIQSIWHDTCTVYVKSPVKHGVITSFDDVVLYEDLPCRLSYSDSKTAQEGELVTKVGQVITLFLASDVEIPAGAKIAVTHAKTTTIYKQSSQIRVHTNHIEVNLDIDTES